MGFNICTVCGAKDGRAGMLIGTEEFPNHACLNCHDTRTTKEIVLHSNLIRTDEEIKKTFNILETSIKL